MSMIGTIAAVSAELVAAFRARPEGASDYATAEAMAGAMDNVPPEVRAQLEQQLEQQFGADELARLQATEARGVALPPHTPSLDLGQSWNVLLFLLSGHAQPTGDLADFLMNGEPLGEDIGYGPPLLHDGDDTRVISAFLAPITAELLVARMDFAAMLQAQVYPIHFLPDDANAQSWRRTIADVFPRLQTYVAEAARRGDGLLFWLS